MQGLSQIIKANNRALARFKERELLCGDLQAAAAKLYQDRSGSEPSLVSEICEAACRLFRHDRENNNV